MEKRMAKYEIDTEFILIVRGKGFVVCWIVTMKWVLQQREMGV
jgi:hypothetical protein